jgi:hypothetical protein
MQAQAKQSVNNTRAFSNLQSAILRLAVKPGTQSAQNRHELNDLVGQALAAYREYMKTVENAKPA